MHDRVGNELIGRAALLPRSQVGVIGPWLVFAWPGNRVIRLDLRLLDRVSVWEAEDDDDASAEDGDTSLVLVKGELETRVHIADGRNAVEQIVREAAPHTRNGAAVAPRLPRPDRPSPTARLVIVSSSPDGEAGASPLDGLVFELSEPRVTIGRTDDNHIVLPHRSISRTHARVTRDSAGSHVVHDLTSTNGVRVNGEVHEAVTLRDGDVVDLGHVRMRFLDALEVDVAGQEAPPDPERFLFFGDDPVLLRDGRIQIGPVAFPLKTVREHARGGKNLSLSEGRVLQAALVLFVAAGRRGPRRWRLRGP